MDEERKPGLVSRGRQWWSARRMRTVAAASVSIAQLSRVTEAVAAVESASPEAVRRLNRDAGLPRSDEALGALTRDEHGLTWEPWGRYRSLGLRRFGIPKSRLVKVDEVAHNSSRRLRVELDDGAVLHIQLVDIPEAIATQLGAPPPT